MDKVDKLVLRRELNKEIAKMDRKRARLGLLWEPRHESTYQTLLRALSRLEQDRS